jgi:hypothetical protein
MQLQIRRVKRVLAVTIGVTLAIISGTHALSSAATRKSPEFAVSLWSSNGHARERLAYSSFVKRVGSSQNSSKKFDVIDRGVSADTDTQFAVSIDQLRLIASGEIAATTQALRDEPLLPKAHALLTIVQKDRARRERMMSLASRLNRRELSLQSVVLQFRAETGDYPQTMNTLDQILRVHPQRQADFFPVLTNALRQRATLTAFRELLAKPLPWREAFLMHAVNDPLAARNLATIRRTVEPNNPDFDRALIANLARNGDLETAASVYGRLIRSGSRGSAFTWTSEYPPFDWSFADEAGLRAQLTPNRRNLEFAVDPGNGGLLATRVMSVPRAPFTIIIKYRLDKNSSANDLKLKLECFGEAAFFESPFEVARGRFDISQTPNCEYVTLSVAGRAWTGANPLNGTLIDVVISKSPIRN